MKIEELREELDLDVEEQEAFDTLLKISDGQDVTREEIEDATKEDAGEVADMLVDVYTASLLEWYKEDLRRTSYADDAISDMGGMPTTLSDVLIGGQTRFWYETVGAVQTKLLKWMEDDDAETQAPEKPTGDGSIAL